MAKSKHKPIVTGENIVVVDRHGATHIQPAKNRKFVESWNAKQRADERSKIFDYDPDHPEMEYYKNKAKGTGNKSAGSGENEFAMKKVIDQNEKLQKTADKQAEQIKKQAQEMEQLKKDLAEMKKSNAAKKPVKDPETV